MDQKIFEIKNRNFAPSEYKLIREQERQNPELEFHTKQVTPNFRLNIVFSTIKLESIILPRMKPKKHFTKNSSYSLNYFHCNILKTS